MALTGWLGRRSRYITAEQVGSQPLAANRTAVAACEGIDLIDVGDGTVALLARINHSSSPSTVPTRPG